jgi:hypothetical protein
LVSVTRLLAPRSKRYRYEKNTYRAFGDGSCTNVLWKPAGARVVVVFRGPGHMVRVTTGDQADTPIMHILTGIAGSDGTAIGAIGRACRRRNLPRPSSRSHSRACDLRAKSLPRVSSHHREHVGYACRLSNFFSERCWGMSEEPLAQKSAALLSSFRLRRPARDRSEGRGKRTFVLAMGCRIQISPCRLP